MAVAGCLAAATLTLGLAPIGLAPKASAAGAWLEVSPEASSGRTSTAGTLTASVTDAFGNGAPGVFVDFEIAAGPADDDLGTAGYTPGSPDMTCVTSGGGTGLAATCSVSYTEADNQAGVDAVLAWIDADGSDLTVEADSAEGVDEGVGAAASCVVGSVGAVRQTDLVARLGGDEFAILTSDEPDLKRSRAMAERLVRELRSPYLIAGHHVIVTTSIGIASARDAIEGAPDLVRNADVAMYMAKANGKSGFAVFDPGMHAAIRERHELGAELQRAVELDQLRLVYQPIVELVTGRLSGAEALVRWQHPERGLIAPGQFIEIAEENGSILPIGRWVLGEACRELSRWQRERRTTDGMFICVNVSAREIQQPGFVEGVQETLREAGLEATALILEITETALLKATPSTIATLGALRELGVRMVIDDFGTGYFSLSHLRQFPVDALKIATEFVKDAQVGSRSSALAGAIVALSHSLAIQTVAEGIETVDQAERMQSLGCTFGQGYFFSEPLTRDEIVAALDDVRASGHEARVVSGGAQLPRLRVAARNLPAIVEVSPV